MQLFVGAILAAVALAIEYPGDECCTLYAGNNYSGAKVTVCTEEEERWFDLNDIGFNNKMNSYWCGAKVAYNFCDEGVNSNCTGDNGTSGAGSNRNKDVWLGAGDWLAGQNGPSSMKIGPYDSAAHGAVILYGSTSCTQQAARFYAHESYDTSAYYTKAELWENNIWDWWINSVTVPYGYSVELYPHDGWTGTPKVFSGSMPGEHDSPQCNVFTWIACNSLIVRRDPAIPPAEAYWSSITASGSIDFDVSYGISQSSSSQDFSSTVHTMDVSMNAGISYGPLSLGGSTQDTTVTTISSDVQQSYSRDVTQNVSLSCDQGEENEGVGLWQFNVSSGDWQSTVYTLHTVCRYGENYNTPPACPWNYCDPLDSQCTTCIDEWYQLVDAADALVLATQVTEAQPAEESHSTAYAGAAFGIVAAIAAGSLYNKCNKKINANEEPLL